MRDQGECLIRVQTTQQYLATKEDSALHDARMMRWFVGTSIALAMFMVVVAAMKLID